ncbi:MAG: LytR C-terminal domain-containing protein [bacterium]
MGISDDIRPQKKIDTTRPINIEGKDNFDVKSFLNKDNQTLSDDFFQNKKKTKNNDIDLSGDNSHENPSAHTFKSFDKKFLWLLLIPILAFFIYQNFKDIRSTFKSDSTENSNTNDDKTYTGEIIPQDYTSTDTSNTNTSTTTNTNAVTETPAVTPEPTTPTEISKSSIKIKILNGNGISKSAQAVKKELINAGFTISNVSNASNFNYLETKIYYKSGKDQQAQLVKDALTSKTSTLAQSDTVAGVFDVVIVVGKN